MKDQYQRQKENVIYQKELLSKIINDETIYVRSIDIIRPEMFNDIYRIVFDSYVKLISDGKKPNIVNLSRIAGVDLDVITDIASFFSGSNITTDSLLYELYERMAEE